MYTLKDLKCPQCGADVTFSKGRQVRCLFCYHNIDVPSEILEPLEEDSQLERGLNQVEQAFKTAKPLVRVTKSWLLLLTVIITIPYTIAVVAIVLSGSLKSGLMAVLIMGGLALMVPVMGVIQVIRNRFVVNRRLASLPAVRLNLERDSISMTCTSCGGVMTPVAGTVTAVCSYCKKESLLPSFAIDEVHQKKHQQIAKLRRSQNMLEEVLEGAGFTIPLLLIMMGGIIVGGIIIDGYLQVSSREVLIDGLVSIYFPWTLINFGIYSAVIKSTRRRLIVGTISITSGIIIITVLPTLLPLRVAFIHIVCILFVWIGFGIHLLVTGWLPKRKKAFSLWQYFAVISAPMIAGILAELILYFWGDAIDAFEAAHVKTAPVVTGPPSEESRYKWEPSRHPILVDLTGDSVMDVIGTVMSIRGGRYHFAAYDSVTQKRLWISESIGNLQAVQVGDKLIGVDGKRLAAFNLADGVRVWGAPLTGKFDHFCGQDVRTVRLVTDDLQEFSVQLIDGQMLILGELTKRPCTPLQGQMDDYRHGPYFLTAQPGFGLVRHRLPQIAPGNMKPSLLVQDSATSTVVAIGVSLTAPAYPLIAAYRYNATNPGVVTPIWQSPLPNQPNARLVGPISATALGRLLIPYKVDLEGEPDRLACFALISGQLLWDVAIPHARHNTRGINASPHHVFVTHEGSDHQLEVFQLSDGAYRFSLGRWKNDSLFGWF